jgi:hypothetical protein
MKHQSAHFVLGGLLTCLLAGCGSSTESPGSGTSGNGGAGAVPMAGNGTGGGSAGMTNGAGTSTGGNVGTGGAGNVAGAAGVMGGSAGSGGMPYEGLYPNGSCSEQTLRTAPPAGKEIFKAEPVDTKFPFSSHWIGPWPANTEPKLMGQTVMADLDDDGDLDFAAGQRDTLPGGMYWWERCSDDHWVAHKVGAGQKSDSSGDALDVDKDGLIDIVSGDSWFKNPGKSREMEWPRFSAGHDLNGEDLTVGDVTGDDMAEIIYVNNGFKPTWYKVGPEPQNGFVLGGELTQNQTIQQGSAWGDLNGDGMNDWLISAQSWAENVNNGASFTYRPIAAAQGFDGSSAGNAPLTFVGDIDGDGDNDFAAGSHWLGGNDNARLAWFENADGKGLTWTMHLLSEEGLYSHGVVLADFDNDKDLDLLWARNVGPSFIYDNTDGKGAFVEHKIVDEFRGHTPRVGDVDCDGDLDMAGGPWGDQAPADHGETTKPPRDYVYLKNHAVENGAPPIFDADRKPYELGWREKYHCR